MSSIVARDAGVFCIRNFTDTTFSLFLRTQEHKFSSPLIHYFRHMGHKWGAHLGRNIHIPISWMRLPYHQTYVRLFVRCFQSFSYGRVDILRSDVLFSLAFLISIFRYSALLLIRVISVICKCSKLTRVLKPSALTYLCDVTIEEAFEYADRRYRLILERFFTNDRHRCDSMKTDR